MTSAQHVVLPRIIGFEREHGLADLSEGHALFPLLTESNLRTALRVADGVYLEKAPLPDTMIGVRGWLPNGGCTYIDINEFVEYASPECLRVAQLVAHHSAVHRVMEPIWTMYDGRPRYRLIGNNLSDRQLGDGPRRALEATYGYHENYLCRTTAIPKMHTSEDAERWQPVLSFLATRQILDGAGAYLDARRDTYAFSQRARFLVNEIAASSTDKRPLILSRDEPHMKQPKGAWRFQLILGDSNTLEWPVFLRFGLTSLVLAMMENNAVEALPCLKRPVTANLALAAHSDPAKNDLELKSGEMVSALDIQIRCVAAIKAFVARAAFECPDDKAEAEEVVSKAEETLEHLRARDIPWLLGRIDYITKREVINAALAREGCIADEDRSIQIRRSLEMSYHDYADNAFGARVRARWPERHIVSKEAVERAARTHEGNTRACTRGKAMEHCLSLGLEKSFSLAYADWSSITLSRPRLADDPGVLPDTHTIQMGDPFVTEHGMPPWPEFMRPL